MTRQALDGFLCCLVGADQFALHGNDVALVARAEELRRQEQGDGRVGMLARRGSEIPVYSLGHLIGGHRDDRVADRHVVVTGGEARPFGLVVDRIVRAAGSNADLLPLPSVIGGAAARWFSGLLTLQETSCLVLAPEGLRPGAAASRRTAANTRARGSEPGEEVRSLVLTFSSEALPPLEDAEQYAVSAARVNAVVQSIAPVLLPGCESHVAGLGCWRRSAVVVLDFSAGGFATQLARRFLIMRCDSGALVAVAVDADTSLRRAAAQDVGDRAPRAQHVRGIFRMGGARVALLDVDRLASGAVAIPAAAGRESLAPALV